MMWWISADEWNRRAHRDVRTTMTRLRGPLSAAAVSLIVLSACAGTTATPADGSAGTGSSGPVAGEAPVLQVRQMGGFAPSSTRVTRLPTVSVYDDGRVMTQGPQLDIYPGPALPGLQVQRIDPAAVDTLIDKAVAAGVKSGADLGRPPVADAPTTRFTVVTKAGTQTVDVIALAEAVADQGGMTAAQKAGRAKLATLLNELTDLPATLGSAGAAAAEPYVPTALAAVAHPFVANDDPALSGQPALPWPGPALPGQSLGAGLELGCVTVTGDQLARVLAAVRQANTATAWASGGKQWSVTFRPLLPEETGCEDLRAAE
jgi:hypothetical protein